MSLVLDASAALAWVYGEGNVENLDDLYREVKDKGAIVPELWHIEIANVLLTGCRKGRHDFSVAEENLRRFSKFRIAVDRETRFRAWDSAFKLGRKHSLTSYDAAYLELAQRLRLPLATLDKELLAAAAAEGVSLFWN